MGCDIHAIVETHEYGSWWPALDCEHLTRWYALFGRFVPHRRGPNETPVAPARGIPEDCSALKWDPETNKLGDHTFSWLTADEFAAALDVPPEYGEVPVSYRAVLAAMQAYAAAGVPVRFVFGFDS